MKKVLILTALFTCGLTAVQAQKFAYVDTEYILEKIPEYTAAQRQIEQLSNQYQATIEAEIKKVDQLFRTYQTEKGRLNDAQRQQREQEIINKEQAVKDLQKSYFGQDGTVTKRTEALIKPIKDRVQRAIDALATEGGYAVIFDTAAAPGFIYTNPAFDLSNRVLEKLGIRI